MFVHALHIAAQGLALFVVGTVVFDAIHWLLHVMADSDVPVVSSLGRLHCSHHDFLDRDLDINRDEVAENLYLHVVPEYGTRAAVTLAALPLLHPVAVWGVFALHTVIFAAVLVGRGRDSNHFETDELGAPANSPFVGPDYHLLHHVYPRRFYSSVVKVFDWVAGTGAQIEGKTVTLTGGSGAFGEPMVELLERAGADDVRTPSFGEDWDYDDYTAIERALADSDILVLAHGSKVDDAMRANCESFIEMIEDFRTIADEQNRTLAPEVWAVGSEIECHPHWGDEELKVYKRSKMAYARAARSYYSDDRILYRHIVPSAFSSPMGPGLISGRTAARIALFFIRRGFHYVPVTYTGIALVNYAKFLVGANAEEPTPSGRPASS